MNEPTHLDLFSGIGGFALAAKWAGFKTIGFSEVDNYASRVLKKHWPDVPNFGNITKWREWPDLGDVQLITGGFPCQPFSCAGKRRGASDDRFLWPAMLDVIGRYRPAWVLGENVPGLIGMELERCLADLECIGFRAATLVIPAAAVDAKHRRDRVWIAAYSRREQRPLQQIERLLQNQAEPSDDGQIQSLAKPNCIQQRQDAVRSGCGARLERRESGQRSEGSGTPSGCGCALADATCERERRLPERQRRQNKAQTNVKRSGEDVANPDSFNAEGIIGVGNDEKERQEQIQRSVGLCDGTGPFSWPAEPDVGRVVNGISSHMDCIGGIPIGAPKPHPTKSKAGRGHRLRGLGNAIVPQVAEVILKAIKQMIDAPIA